MKKRITWLHTALSEADKLELTDLERINSEILAAARDGAETIVTPADILAVVLRRQTQAVAA